MYKTKAERNQAEKRCHIFNLTIIFLHINCNWCLQGDWLHCPTSIPQTVTERNCARHPITCMKWRTSPSAHAFLNHLWQRLPGGGTEFRKVMDKHLQYNSTREEMKVWGFFGWLRFFWFGCWLFLVGGREWENLLFCTNVAELTNRKNWLLQIKLSPKFLLKL